VLWNDGGGAPLPDGLVRRRGETEVPAVKRVSGKKKAPRQKPAPRAEYGLTLRVADCTSEDLAATWGPPVGVEEFAVANGFAALGEHRGDLRSCALEMGIRDASGSEEGDRDGGYDAASNHAAQRTGRSTARPAVGLC
jgi:hypothetical protein